VEKNSRPPLTFLAYDYSRAVETYVTDWYQTYTGVKVYYSPVGTLGNMDVLSGRIIVKVA